MKRIIVLSAVFLLICTAVFADSYVKGDSLESLANKTPQQKVSLSLASIDSFEFGFSTESKTIPSSTAELTATTLALSAADKTIADNESSPLYIWWKITTSETFKVKLAMDGALKYNEDNIIDWTVTRASDDTTPLTGVENIDLSSVSAEGKDSCTFISHTNSGENTLVNYSGEQKLYISTVKNGNTLVGKATGEGVVYESTLTLSISAS